MGAKKMDSFNSWMKKNLFSTPSNSILTIIILSLIFKSLGLFVEWLFIDSTWSGTALDCREGSGACLVFIREKFKFILFGFFPQDILWRPITGVILLIIGFVYSARPSNWNKKTLLMWLPIMFCFFLLMGGGLFGLRSVDVEKWGGLPLTLMLAFVGLVFAYPIGVLLALARSSKDLPLIKSMSVIYIELIRGVPLISLLFMSSVMLPLFLPEGFHINKLLRAQIALIMFMAAYMAEVVRGGLAAIPSGQYEAADALGLGYWKKMRLVILPQALKVVIPPTVNTIIGMFKDTSLVMIISLFDLLMTAKSALKDPQWLGFSIEAYLFIALIYFIFCFSMGRYANFLEKRFSRGEVR